MRGTLPPLPEPAAADPEDGGFRHSLSACAAVVLALGGTMALLHDKVSPASRLAEAAIYLILLVLFFRSPLTTYLRSRARPSIVAGLVTIAVFAQLAGSARETFPLVRYSMYSDPAPSFSVATYWIDTAPPGGDLELFDAKDAWPALNHGRFGSRERLALSDSVTTTALLKAVAHKATQEVDSKICSIELRRAEGPIEQVRSGTSVTNELVERVELEC